MKRMMIGVALAVSFSAISFAVVPGNPGPGQPGGLPENLQAVRVQVAWSPVLAKPANSEAIDVEITVTDYKTGAAVGNLSEAHFHFKFMEYGCLGTYGADISHFGSNGNGVYLLKLKPHPIGGCATWQAVENHAVEVVVYQPTNPINPLGRYGITAARIEVQ